MTNPTVFSKKSRRFEPKRDRTLMALFEIRRYGTFRGVIYTFVWSCFPNRVFGFTVCSRISKHGLENLGKTRCFDHLFPINIDAILE